MGLFEDSLLSRENNKNSNKNGGKIEFKDLIISFASLMSITGYESYDKDKIDKLVEDIQKQVYNSLDQEISSKEIGL